MIPSGGLRPRLTSARPSRPQESVSLRNLWSNRRSDTASPRASSFATTRLRRIRQSVMVGSRGRPISREPGRVHPPAPNHRSLARCRRRVAGAAGPGRRHPRGSPCSPADQADQHDSGPRWNPYVGCLPPASAAVWPVSGVSPHLPESPACPSDQGNFSRWSSVHEHPRPITALG